MNLSIKSTRRIHATTYKPSRYLPVIKRRDIQHRNPPYTLTPINSINSIQTPPKTLYTSPPSKNSQNSKKMPTPLSASHISRRPTVPPTFEGVNYDDQTALKAAQDSVIKEQWVRSMMARLVREELGRCYYREGVNHLERCGRLRGSLFFKFDF